jgi:hypothetical protein
MKLIVNFGDELKHAKINLSKVVPVTKNFDNTKLLGEAEVKQDGEDTIAELNIVNETEGRNIKHILECGAVGTVTKRKGNLITGFDLKGVSIQLREDTKVKPKIRDKMSKENKNFNEAESQALNIADVMAMLPTKEEIENEANSYDNSMASMTESVWMPQGFKEGVEWTIKKLKKRLNGN